MEKKIENNGGKQRRANETQRGFIYSQDVRFQANSTPAGGRIVGPVMARANTSKRLLWVGRPPRVASRAVKTQEPEPEPEPPRARASGPRDPFNFSKIPARHARVRLLSRRNSLTTKRTPTPQKPPTRAGGIGKYTRPDARHPPFNSHTL